jgi:transposase InsO family protein
MGYWNTGAVITSVRVSGGRCMEWFRSRAEAKVVVEQWRQHYNADRPHSSLGYLSPLTFKQQDPEQQNKILHKQQRKQKPSTNPEAILN